MTKRDIMCVTDHMDEYENLTIKFAWLIIV